MDAKLQKILNLKLIYFSKIWSMVLDFENKAVLENTEYTSVIPRKFIWLMLVIKKQPIRERIKPKRKEEAILRYYSYFFYNNSRAAFCNRNVFVIISKFMPTSSKPETQQKITQYKRCEVSE